MSKRNQRQSHQPSKDSSVLKMGSPSMKSQQPVINYGYIDENSEEFVAPQPRSFQLEVSKGSLTLERMKSEGSADSKPTIPSKRASIATIEISEEDNKDLYKFISSLDTSEELLGDYSDSDDDDDETDYGYGRDEEEAENSSGNAMDQRFRNGSLRTNGAPSRPNRRKSSISFVVPEHDAAQMARFIAAIDDESSEDSGETDYEAIDHPGNRIPKKPASSFDHAPRRALRKVSIEFSLASSDDDEPSIEAMAMTDDDDTMLAQVRMSMNERNSDQTKLTLREASLRTMMKSLTVSRAPRRRSKRGLA